MSGVRVRAVDATGAVVHEAELSHGADPQQVLTNAGWQARWAGAHHEAGVTVLRYAVSPAPVPHPFQRVAAYAVVVTAQQDTPSVLLTSFTGAPDVWGPPGGGIDDGEHPPDAVLREVWEETGQRVRITRELAVDTDHWTGRSPGGRWEDFHAVRLVYVADCPEPTEAVVHDVDGSTDRADWVPLTQLSARRVLPWAAPLIRRVVGEAADLP